MSTHDPILDSDLNAYVDDQLDVGRRIEVEAYLSEHPDIAAKVMADLRVKDELRLALAELRPVPSQKTRDAARRLEQALSRKRYSAFMQRAAMIALLIGAGWAGHAYLGPFGFTDVVASEQPPVFVREAVAAHRTTQLRSSMVSQATPGKFDPAEIRASTAIALPDLPAGWKVTDTQIFPSANGPSVELAIEERSGRRLSLFAERPGTFSVEPVNEVTDTDAVAAYWQIGDVAYALVADPGTGKLREAADRLARTLY
ncbi:anti-sigma factor family protein [Rhizobium alvei]|uniref:Anti-sigma factor n=1 Tax=Rhizobium alvei TaxID=1132659 RepID=A0ABT8YJE0_9HYPH|nr:anti-sigma factor [Rhizobium alvei]MDO6963636.1 anti-sigma factor [Rhizobium alvei]